MPQRLQRMRTKGWRKPAGSVVVSRPSRFGNPFVVGQPYHLADEATGEIISGVVSDRAAATALYRRYLDARPELRDRVREQLHDKDLLCFCPLDGQPCHADVLLAVAAEKE